MHAGGDAIRCLSSGIVCLRQTAVSNRRFPLAETRSS